MLPKAAASEMNKKQKTFFRRMFLILVSFWTILILLFLILIYEHKKDAIFDVAVKECKTDFEKDVQYRFWATLHGGVYVPQTDQTPPNPYLSDIPERDVTTESGKKLTLMNPAYMTRQVFELGKEKFNYKGHITSLNPIRKENSPDKWEANALKTFEKGVREKIEITNFEGENHIRYMAPFITEKGCLKCHETQGYKIGQVRGGISISLPWKPFDDLLWHEMKYVIAEYLGIWILGFAGLFFSFRRIGRKNVETENLTEELRLSEEKYRTLIEFAPETFLQGDLKGNLITVNERATDLTGYSRDELLKMNLSELFPEEVLINNPLNYELVRQGQTVLREREIQRKDGKRILVEMISKLLPDNTYQCYMRDISERKKSEEAIKQSEMMLNTLLNGIHESALLIDVNGTVLAANDTVDQRVNNGEKNIVGKNIYDLIPKYVGDKRRRYIESVVKTGKAERFVDERYGRIIDNSITPILEEDGTVTKIALVGYDITDKIRAEEVMNKSRELLTKLAEQVPGVVYQYRLYKDGQSCFPYASPGMIDIYGVTPEEVREDATPVFGRLHPEDFEFIVSTIQESARTLKLYHSEFRVILPDKGVQWRLCDAKPEKLEDGSVLWHGIISDITDRKIAEEKLKESEEKFRLLLNSAAEAIYGLDLNGNCSFCNASAVKILGYAGEDELIGKNMHNLIHHSRADGSPVLEQDCEIFKAFRSGGGTHVENEVLWRKDGSSFDAEYWSYPIHRDNNLIGAVVSFLDISPRRQAEAELEKYRNHLEELVETRTEELDAINMNLKREIELKQEAERQLEEALLNEKQLSQLKSRFISTASHEFRTPLTSVLTSTELIQRYYHNWSNEKIEEHLERIKHSVNNLTKLMDNVLLVNRAESGRVTLNPSSIDFFNLCGKAIEEARVHLTGKHQINLSYNTPEKIFILDRNQVDLILHNLLSNAIKYSPEGGTIGLEVDSDEKNLKFKISDPGIGIPGEDIPRLFESFHRSKNSESIQGTGLGLSIVKHAADLLGGSIDIQSELGAGTVVTVTIPLKR